MPDRSIRNIQVHHRHPQHQHQEAPAPRQRRRRGGGRLWVVGAFVIIAAAILGALLSLIFAGASVSVTPRTATVSLPGSIQAVLNAPAGTLAFQQATVSLSATTTVPANGTQQVSKPAQGTLTISNTYSTSPQRLIANTRFQASDGKIYRIRDSVSVPGMQGGQAGTVTATAFADTAGPDYNRSGTTVYTIPGFKGDPRYAKITAVSGAMTGGFVGNQPAVSQTDLSVAKQAMEQQLDAAVRKQFGDNLPAGYQLVQGTLMVTFSDISQSDAGGNQAALSETATANGDVVRTADLASAVARQTVQGYKGEAVLFSAPISTSASTTAQSSSISIQLAGQSATLVWQFDPSALKQALIGQPKSSFEDIVKQFEPAIAKADASIRPFWTSTFPSDASKISVSVVQSQ